MCVKLRFFGFACTVAVQQFVAPMEIGMDVLSPEEEQIRQKTMHRLAERVCGGVGVGGMVCGGKGCGEIRRK